MSSRNTKEEEGVPEQGLGLGPHAQSVSAWQLRESPQLHSESPAAVAAAQTPWLPDWLLDQLLSAAAPAAAESPAQSDSCYQLHQVLILRCCQT